MVERLVALMISRIRQVAWFLLENLMTHPDTTTRRQLAPPGQRINLLKPDKLIR